MAQTQRDIKLKNCQIYDENGDAILGTLEAKFVLKMEYGDVNRLQKGKVQTVNDWHIEVTLKVSSVNPALKYYVADQLTDGKTPILPMLIGETVDKEADKKERVKLSNIYLNPEELTLLEAKAEGNDIATYDLKGMSNVKPVFLDKLPIYTE